MTPGIHQGSNLKPLQQECDIENFSMGLNFAIFRISAKSMIPAKFNRIKLRTSKENWTLYEQNK